MTKEQRKKMLSYIALAREMKMICYRAKNCTNCPFNMPSSGCGLDDTPKYWYIHFQMEETDG